MSSAPIAAAAGSQGALPVDLYDETSLVILARVAESGARGPGGLRRVTR